MQEVLEGLVAKYRQNPHNELEVRIGKIQPNSTGNTFNPGLHVDYINNLVNVMTESNAVSISDPEVFTRKYIKKDSVRVTIQKDNPTFESIHTVEHVDMSCVNRFHDVRITVKTETPINMKRYVIDEKPYLLRVIALQRLKYKGNPFTIMISRDHYSHDSIALALKSERRYCIEIELDKGKLAETYMSTRKDKDVVNDILGMIADVLGHHGELSKRLEPPQYQILSVFQ